MAKQLKFFPSELALLTAALLGVALFNYHGVPLRSPLQLYFQKISGGLVWYLTGLILCLFLIRLKDIQRSRSQSLAVSWKSTLEYYRVSYLSMPVLLRDLRFVHLLSFLFVVFLHLKHLIPSINPVIYDEAFIASDRYLCAGKTCGELLVETFGLNSASFFSSAYVFFYPYLGLLLMTMVLQRREQLTHQFCLSFVLLWLAGILIVYLIPTWGPCYSVPEGFSQLPPTRVRELQQELWNFRVFLLEFPKSEKGAYLISGFPSLHLAAVVLGSLYLGHVHRILALFSWLFFLVTICSTLYFGWHFMLDDIGGVLLAVFVYYLISGSGRIERTEK